MAAISGVPVRLSRYHFTRADVVSRTWRFGPPDAERAHAPHLKLLENGALGGHKVETEWTWGLEDGVIVFYNRIGRHSTVFDQVHVRPDGKFVLLGGFKLEPAWAAFHELREIDPVHSILTSAEPLPTIVKPHAIQRRNLVVVPCNERSLHREWLQDIADHDRSWDLLAAFWGDASAFGQDPVADIQVHQPGVSKFRQLYRLFHDCSVLWKYDYIGVVDDDMMTTWAGVNEMFEICSRYQLKMAQPALTPDSHIAHPITRRQDDYLLRYVSFVESMTPFFSREALRACIPTFSVESRFGFGVDHVWPKLIGEPMNGMAIIDRVPFAHTRATGANYVHWDELQAGSAFQNLYDAPDRIWEFGGIRSTPIPRQ